MLDAASRGHRSDSRRVVMTLREDLPQRSRLRLREIAFAVTAKSLEAFRENCNRLILRRWGRRSLEMSKDSNVNLRLFISLRTQFSGLSAPSSLAFGGPITWAKRRLAGTKLIVNDMIMGGTKLLKIVILQFFW
jgi:hypothetical protein